MKNKYLFIYCTLALLAFNNGCSNESSSKGGQATSCGDGICQADENCSTCIEDCACGQNEICSAAGTCEPSECEPDCGEQQCVPDGCGGICGSCVPDNVAEALLQTGIIAGPALLAGQALTFDVEVQEETEIELLAASNRFTRNACNYQAENLGMTLHVLMQNGQPGEQVLQIEAASGYRGHNGTAFVFDCPLKRAILTPGNYRLTLRNRTDNYDFEEASYVIEARAHAASCGDGILNIGEACDGAQVPGSIIFEEQLINRCENCMITDAEVAGFCFDNDQRSPTYRNLTCGGERGYCINFVCKEHICGDGILDRAVPSLEILSEQCDLGDLNGVPNSGCGEQCTIAEVSANLDLMQTGFFYGPAIATNQSIHIDFTVEVPSTLQILPAANEYSWASCSPSASNLGLQIFSMQNENVGEAVLSEEVPGYRSKNLNLRCKGLTANLDAGDYRLILTNTTDDYMFRAGSYVIEVRKGEEAVCGNDVLNIGEACDGPNIAGAVLFGEFLIDRCENCQITPSVTGDRCYSNEENEPATRNISCAEQDNYCRSIGCLGDVGSCLINRCQQHRCGDGIVDPALENLGLEAEECDLGDRNGTERSWCNDECRKVPVEFSIDLLETGFYLGPEIPLDQSVSILFSSEQNTSIEIQPAPTEFTPSNCNYTARNIGLALFKVLQDRIVRVGERIHGYGLPNDVNLHFACQGWSANLEPGDYKLVVTSLISPFIRGREPIAADSYILEVRAGDAVCGDDRLNIGEVCDGPNVPGAALLIPYITERCNGCTLTESAEGEYCDDVPDEGISYRDVTCADDGNYCRTSSCFDDVEPCAMFRCKPHQCGDGITDPAANGFEAEECDLGGQNGVEGSGCNADCTNE